MSSAPDLTPAKLEKALRTSLLSSLIAVSLSFLAGVICLTLGLYWGFLSLPCAFTTCSGSFSNAANNASMAFFGLQISIWVTAVLSVALIAQSVVYLNIKPKPASSAIAVGGVVAGATYLAGLLAYFLISRPH